MENWITWCELKDRWEINDFNLAERLKEGPQPYESPGNPFHCPKPCHVYWPNLNRHTETGDILLGLDKLKEFIKEKENEKWPASYDFLREVQREMVVIKFDRLIFAVIEDYNHGTPTSDQILIRNEVAYIPLDMIPELL